MSVWPSPGRTGLGQSPADISDIVRSPDGHRKMTDQRPSSVPGCIKGARPASGVFPVLEVRQSCTRILHFCEFFWIFVQALSCIGHRSRPDTSRDTQGTRTYPGQTPYDCVISADYRTRIGRAPEGDRTISDDDRPMSLRHPITNCPPLSTHCRQIIFRIWPEALSSPEKNLTTTTMTNRFSPALRHRRTPPICRYPPAAGLNVTEV